MPVTSKADQWIRRVGLSALVALALALTWTGITLYTPSHPAAVGVADTHP